MTPDLAGANTGIAATPAGNGKTISRPVQGGDFSFNPTLFANYAAALADGKQLGAWTPAGESEATMAALTSAVTQPM